MTDTMKLPTPLEAADRVDEGHAVASGLGLDEVAALLRSMAQCSGGSDEALARQLEGCGIDNESGGKEGPFILIRPEFRDAIVSALRGAAQAAQEPDDFDEYPYDDERFNRGVEHVVVLLAKTIQAPDTWHSGDGSEDYDEDLAETARQANDAAARVVEDARIDSEAKRKPVSSTSRATGPLVPWEFDCRREVCAAPECDCPAVTSTHQNSGAK